MFKRALLTSVLVFLPIVCAHAQSLTWCVGVAGGAARGVNEDHDQATQPIVRLEGALFSDEISNASPSLGISVLTLASAQQGGAYDYTTSIIAPDIRARLSPYHTENWFPYVNLGFGIAFYTVRDVPPAIGSGAKTEGGLVFFPVGAGVFHRLAEHVAADLNVSNALSVSDDIDPVHDGHYDAWWTMTMSLYFVF